MTFSIRNDRATQTAQRLLRLNQLATEKSLQRLTTGRRINRAADNPAGLIAAEQLSSSLAALEAESRVTERARAVTATADAALGEASSLLTEAKRLTVANADSTLSADERAANQAQIDSIVASVDRIGNTTQFNGTKLLDGNLTLSVTGASVQVAQLSSGETGAQQIDGEEVSLASLKTGGSLSSAAGRSEDAAKVVDKAISDVATARARLGAFDRNTLQTRQNAAGVAIENLSAARSAIVDTDYARTTAEAFRSQLLTRAGVQLLRESGRSRTNAFGLLFGKK